MEHIDRLNYLAIDVLDRLGNEKPTESQIELMKLLISDSVFKKKIEISRDSMDPAIYKKASNEPE